METRGRLDSTQGTLHHFWVVKYLGDSECHSPHTKTQGSREQV